jgi:25S rRNA (uracil2843-N3)-methyltransferase
MASHRPRWGETSRQAPSKPQKQQKVKGKALSEAPVAAPSIPLEIQQVLMNIFKDSFDERFAADIKPLLQEVKGHLYNRDFATAFGKNEYLEAYAARWSASRALGYADLFMDLRAQLWPENALSNGASGEGSKRRKIVCLGGGAGAELVALAGVQNMLHKNIEEQEPAQMVVDAVDIADWTTVVDALAKHITTPPPLSKYASASAKEANAPLINAKFLEMAFKQIDILTAESSVLATMVQDATLVTLMFTLNELYSTSVSLTQKFLLNLTSNLASGALLLVVDSPGSYSTVTLNGAEKKYPMQWLLDHTLLQTGEKDKNKEKARWEKIHEDESRWFRLAPTLRYPIELENMRMQLHLYRKL